MYSGSQCFSRILLNDVLNRFFEWPSMKQKGSQTDEPIFIIDNIDFWMSYRRILPFIQKYPIYMNGRKHCKGCWVWPPLCHVTFMDVVVWVGKNLHLCNEGGQVWVSILGKGPCQGPWRLLVCSSFTCSSHCLRFTLTKAWLLTMFLLQMSKWNLRDSR